MMDLDLKGSEETGIRMNNNNNNLFSSVWFYIISLFLS